MLSTFPPNQAEGAFSSRLPQIVLKRRTLPWERDRRKLRRPAPRDRRGWRSSCSPTARASCSATRRSRECVTSGVVLAGRNDVAEGDRPWSPQRVVDQVFPTKDELPLLAHVRDVDLSDTELALGDDDGWLAVVLCQPPAAAGPVRYLACLI